MEGKHQQSFRFGPRQAPRGEFGREPDRMPASSGGGETLPHEAVIARGREDIAMRIFPQSRSCADWTNGSHGAMVPYTPERAARFASAGLEGDHRRGCKLSSIYR